MREIVVLRPMREEIAHSYPAYVDEDGGEWAVNHEVTGEGVNDACDRCGRDIQHKAFSVFLWGGSELRCSDCVRFIEGAHWPAREDR